METIALSGKFNSLLKNKILVRLLKNSAYLFSGNVLGDLFTMAALALTARKLGPELFGVFVLIQAYAFIVTQLLNFQSWQALVKFGAEKLEQKKETEFVELVSLCFFLDVAVALLATLLALLMVGRAAAWYGWDQNISAMASVYCLTILFSLTDTSIGVLQIFDKFKVLAIQNTVVAFFKFFCVLAAFYLDGGLWSFLLIWLAAGAVAALFLVAAGWKVLAVRFGDKLRFSGFKSAVENNKGIIAFMTTTNLHSSIRLTSRELDLMIIGAFLGPASAGMLKIVKQIASLFTRIASPLYNAIYPELARLWAAKDLDGLIALIRQSFLIAFVPSILFCLGFLAVGKPVIVFFLGTSYSPVYLTSVVYNLAVLVALVTFSFHPLMLAMGRARQSLMILVFSTAAYFLFLVPLLKEMDMLGVAVAYLLFYLLWSFLMVASLRRALGRARGNGVCRPSTSGEAVLE